MIQRANAVTEAQFRRHWNRYIAAANSGNGPVAVTRDDAVLGFFVGADEFEHVFAKAMRRLLAARMTGPTVSQAEARNHIRQVIRRRARKP